MTNSDEKSKGKWSGKNSPYLIVLAFIVGISFFFIPDRNKPLTPEEEAERCNKFEHTALSMAQKFVLDGLKAPSTAKFPSSDKDSKVKSIGECKYEIRSFVDAQNSFGAQIRNKFYAVVQYKGERKWEPLIIKLDE